MPDGDIAHASLPNRFLDVYAQLCEGHWEPSTLAHNVLLPLKKQIQSHGNAPIEMGKKIVPILERAVSKNVDFQDDHFGKARSHLEDLRKDPKMNCSPRGRDLMQEAGKKILFRIQQGTKIEDIEYELMKTYVDTVYKKEFEMRIHDVSTHHKEASHSDVEEQKQLIRPHIEQGEEEFARQLVNHGDVEKLRRPPQVKEPPPEVNDVAW